MKPNTTTDTTIIRIGISACLLGERVRYDGNHRLDAALLAAFPAIFAPIPICPEVAIGMGVPREPIHLVGDPRSPRAIGTLSPHLDVTDALIEFGRRMAEELRDISGYIFKARSPSCGVERVPIHPATPSGSGIYVQTLTALLPRLPIADDEQLRDGDFRNRFFQRVVSFHNQQKDR